MRAANNVKLSSCVAGKCRGLRETPLDTDHARSGKIDSPLFATAPTLRHPMKSLRDKLLLVFVCAASLTAAVLIQKYGRHRDPADNGSWYLAVFGLAFAAGLISPPKPWRWGIAVVVPQWILVFYPEVSNLWPMAIVFMSFLMLPGWLCAWIGAKLRTKFDEMTGRAPAEPPVIESGSK